MAHRRSAHRRNPSVDQPKYAPQAAVATPSSSAAAVVPLAQISDYESDIPAYGSELAHQPPPSNRTTQELNLSVLQRHDPEVAAILSIAPYAVIYEFSPLPQPAWAKTGVEGTLFVCQLTPGPFGEDRYAAMVLNRRGLDNFEAPLMEEEDAGVEMTDEYVIISFKQGHEQKIYGVFIFSEGPGSSTADTRDVNANLMKTLATLASASRRTAERDAAEAQAQDDANGYQEETEDRPAQSTLPDARRQHISLQQLFGQQRAQDASFSVRTHNLDGSIEGTGGPAFVQNGHSIASPQEVNVIGSLFRRAGIGMG
ncbi:hypothetical protein DV735_g3752, partial [Chaetothyriales sp. CBS 134920]